jgi:glycosyltransferase involved in cell wall biosynthesis
VGGDREHEGGEYVPSLGMLSVILPAYDEEPNLPTLLERALEVLPDVCEEWEVIVVDDGSRDGTAAAVAPFVDEHHPRIRLLRHPRNLGYGAALRSGFRAARGDLVFYTDADHQFDLGELAWFVPALEGRDVLVGFRVYRYDSVLRCILAWGYNRLVGALFRVRVRDVDCSYKLFRREALERIEVETSDFFVDTELVAKARRMGHDIAERGVRHYPRAAGRTTVRPSDIPRTLRVVARMWRRLYLPGATPEPVEGEAVELLPAAAR